MDRGRARARWIAFFLSLAGALSAALPVPRADAAASPLRVLFVGNSLTTVNNVPALVEALGRARETPIECRTVAFNGFSLDDHWVQGDARRAIRQGGWTTVVLQQGPSALPASRVALRESTKRFDGEIRRVGARTALYMVWPSSQRRGDFEGVSASYTAAARVVHGLLLPVGDAWREAWRRDGTLAFYGGDGFHPTPLGSYVAALVIYQKLTGQSPVGLPATLASRTGDFPAILLPDRDAALVQHAAADANATAPDR